MPIRASVEHLPRSHRDEGNPPSRNNFVVELLAQRWYDKYLEARGGDLDNKPRAIPEAGPYRASFASKRCDRALAYAMADVPASDPPGIAEAWTFYLGDVIHEKVQELVLETFPGARAEPKVDLRPAGLPGSGHVDLMFEYEIAGDKVLVLVELKSINGFSFKMIATSFKGPAQGPRYGAVLQAAMAAKALGIQHVVVGYLSLEKVSPELAEAYSNSEAGRFAAEWHYTLDELEPLIQAESNRVNEILTMLDDPVSVPRQIHDPEIPATAVIQNPAAARAPWTVVTDGVVVDSGTTWYCGYCPHRQQCIEDGA